MSEHLSAESSTALDPEDQDSLRALNRTPHPYHHQNFELPHSSDRFVYHKTAESSNHDDPPGQVSPAESPVSYKESSPASDSGTEADDEHFLKGLPAPKSTPHKGVIGRNEVLSGSSTPLLSPTALEEEQDLLNRKPLRKVKEALDKRRVLDLTRRKRVIVRRATELGLITSLGLIVRSNQQLSPVLDIWYKDFQLLGLLYTSLLALYPVRVAAWTRRHGKSVNQNLPEIPANFDPAPLLYPPAITTFVSLLVSVNNPAVVLPNIILSISSIPQQVVPKLEQYAPYDTLHWVISCLPLIWGTSQLDQSRFIPTYSFLTAESIVLLYPLHRTLCAVLHDLTTTSLLTTELQLLSVSLINVLLLASSPQVQILKSLLWGGGLSLLIFCGAVIQWGITLARVPKWRFRRSSTSQKHTLWGSTVKALSWKRIKSEVLGSTYEGPVSDTPDSSEEEDDEIVPNGLSRACTFGPTVELPVGAGSVPSSPDMNGTSTLNPITRRHTVPHPDKYSRKSVTHTPSGRRKRATSVSVRPYFKLTQSQATVRKWLYAAYVYLCLLVTIVAVIRVHIAKYALSGEEPIGWALGYAFGGWRWFRFEVISANLERWICLPALFETGNDKECHLGWVQHIRHTDFGEANTRLLIVAYWLVILVVGLAIVFRLTETYEVDTRRKVFHFMMVGMLLPATFVDPTFAGLCLSLALAIFLLLDLLRASQLPPLSKPIASFLAPYVDGRDFSGPVVISHIFLLIGCAIPLWLALASLPRTGLGYLAGWEVPSRDVSMLSGVVCVGLGDAAASLIGRRYGHRKWVWGGGKSLEGSAAFVAAVFAGLAASSMWLRVGGWPTTDEANGLVISAGKSLICASMASVTEAVLTGGNDNVIVPVVLWTCVKGLGI